MAARVLAVAAVLLLVCSTAARAQTPPPDPCSQFPTCQQCVASPLCGWCSNPVTYVLPDGQNVTGSQCAGFSPDGRNPFVCSGIYSTEQCVSGYECDLATFTCRQGAPGTGEPLDICQQNCTNQGQVFLCNQTTQKCYQVPQGTPDASSLIICEAACAHPTAHPSSPNPAPPPAETYDCNVTTGKCEASTPGHGSSKEVCEQNCKKGEESYMCNTYLHKCIKLPPGTPGGQPLATCEQQCNPKPDPGPPGIFLGMWRGIAIQNGYKAGEWDINVTRTEVTIVDVASAATTRGTPQHASVNGQDILIIAVTSGPGVGQEIRAIGESANRGPETTFLTAALSQPGGSAPASIAAAMKSGSDTVLALAQCVQGVDCVFTMPVSLTGEVRRAASAQAIRAAYSDPCAAYAANCSYCIHAPFYCGWCSKNVQYANGEVGTQCAGFGKGDSNTSDPFVCQGRYSTTNCDVGYNCETSTGQCVPNPVPGNGLPKEQCEQICHPPPSPTPRPDQYVCNITEKKCFMCNDTFCPGAMPKETCAAACVKPKPGPSDLVIGVWRGLEIQNGYPLGEVDWVFNASSFSLYHSGTVLMSGTVESFGGDLMVLVAKTGVNSGHRFSAIYSIQNQGAMYEWMTIALSLPDGPIPDGYQTPMITKGMQVQVMAKCNQAPCKFNAP